eukprot:scaffold110619_cov51-Attheya_sp.AAC.2
MRENWEDSGLIAMMKENASKRNLQDLTVDGPVLTHTTENILSHLNHLLKIEGAKLLFGGKELANHNIPAFYGAVEPTAVFVPSKEMMKQENFEDCTKEIFAPFQVVTEYKHDTTLDLVLDALERISHHLTAAIISNDLDFQMNILSNTVNGTTYADRRARTTGAPQNHWFGPAGDPGDVESVLLRLSKWCGFVTERSSMIVSSPIIRYVQPKAA